MKEIIVDLITLADMTQDESLIALIRTLLDKFAETANCPSNWRILGTMLSKEYLETSWSYINLSLDDYADY